MFLERAKQDDVEAGRCRIPTCVDSGLPPGLEIRIARIEGVEATVTLEAGADATRLLQLSGEDRFTWRNRKPDALIDLVKASGHCQPVRWRLTLAASQIGSREGRVRLRFEVSASLAKNFTLHENLRLQLIVQAFNAVNHVNLANPDT